MENNSFYFNILRCRNFSILMINEITVVEKFLPPRIFLYNEFCKGLFSIYFGLKYNSFWYYIVSMCREIAPMGLSRIFYYYHYQDVAPMGLSRIFIIIITKMSPLRGSAEHFSH